MRKENKMPQNDKNKVRFTPVRTVESKMSENIDENVKRILEII